MHIIRVGPAGWSYKDWEGTVYPPHGSRFDPLAYLASYFDTIEINAPFYRTPPPAHPRSWVRRVAANPAFRFTTKVFRGFTHDKNRPDAAEVRAVRSYLDALMEDGRLGAILLQFPWSFKNGEEERARLVELFDTFSAYPRALEVRHGSFQEESFYRFLSEHVVSWVNIDQPVFPDSVKPAATVTGPVAYARFHGRNFEKWFNHTESWERYNYLYQDHELEPWLERIRTMAGQKETYVVTNNHFRGQAIVNAGDLKRGLGLDAAIPPTLKSIYQPIAEP